MKEIFGTLGFTGAAVVMTAFLILGARGAWKIKLNQEGVIVVAYVTGQLYAQAGQTFAFVGDTSGGLSDAIRSGFGPVANFGAGAVAILVALIIYGFKPNKFRNGVLALMLPALFTAAGGLPAVLTHIISNLTHTAVA